MCITELHTKIASHYFTIIGLELKWAGLRAEHDFAPVPTQGFLLAQGATLYGRHRAMRLMKLSTTEMSN